jgi:hypothetical protein
MLDVNTTGIVNIQITVHCFNLTVPILSMLSNSSLVNIYFELDSEVVFSRQINLRKGHHVYYAEINEFLTLSSSLRQDPTGEFMVMIFLNCVLGGVMSKYFIYFFSIGRKSMQNLWCVTRLKAC